MARGSARGGRDAVVALARSQTRAPRAAVRLVDVHHGREVEGLVDDLLRRPARSKQERMIDWHTETFWCMTTEPGGAPMMRASASPDASPACSHQPSAQARTPRVAQRRGVLREVGARPAGHGAQGMADQVRASARIGNSAPASRGRVLGRRQPGLQCWSDRSRSERPQEEAVWPARPRHLPRSTAATTRPPPRRPRGRGRSRGRRL